MTLNDDVKYYLIFDTNVLFQAYEKKLILPHLVLIQHMKISLI